ncbi:MAG TPA: M43 family zinc metalloprotease, partial [Flavobacteriaceae bacterium]|nr:M43 family zinc metalloprotease [Flavobacteriaceae bacterium]
VLSQITVMNQDFRKMLGTPGYNTNPIGADVEVEFVLAQRTPSGCPTTGINRVNICQDGTTQSDVQYWKTQTYWDPSKYMNMWSSKYVGDLDGILGYAQFPGGAANTDGVSSSYTYFGSSDYDDGTFELSAPYDKGRTMTHEVGHYLGLFHTFEGGCSGAGDQVADTPPVASPNYGCPTGTDSCAGGGLDMIENYMDYSDDTCMNIFTAGQKTRVQNVLATMANRMSLAASDGATPPVAVAVDAAIQVESASISCGTEMTPVVRLTNWGTSTLTTATITYDVDSGIPANMTWTGSLNEGEFESITLPNIASSAGSHTINVSVSVAGDGRACNNAHSNCFTLTANSGPCTSVANTTYQTSVTNVAFNTINNASAKPAGYSDYTAISTDVNIDSVYNLAVQVNTDGNYPVGTMVWIDWNQNCNFESSEAYNMGVATNVTNGPTSNSPLAVTVPNNAVLGTTVMRVVTKYNSYPSSCENNHDAEVEDYSVNVLSSLSTDEFTENAISLYPNPTKDALNIKVSNSELPSAYIIYNAVGQVIAQKTINSDADLTINTTTYSNGMYFIKISKDSNTVSLPFVKQ